MSSELVGRTELEDLLSHDRKKIQRLEQLAAEAREEISSFRAWSVIEAARVRQLERWLLDLMPADQRECIVGDDESALIDGAQLERTAAELEAFVAMKIFVAGDGDRERATVVSAQVERPSEIVTESRASKVQRADDVLG